METLLHKSMQRTDLDLYFLSDVDKEREIAQILPTSESSSGFSYDKMSH